ncbi:MAG: tRNA (N(6)-L-threonylcarbamoyladenosine(37)-C(2))-methylthiotransferase MtaB [Chitinivibrionales bacterium]|nr:tRNA (N(6)-L-threonylcarbamoyladenosine(37)-C(2))-methylthiotransferase MtaB [Chitinivibrionales bacterium]
MTTVTGRILRSSILRAFRIIVAKTAMPNPPIRRIAFKTLGCRLNQYETDSLEAQFRRAGYRIVDYRDHADAYVVNTCTVTSRSDQKSRNSIHQATRSNNDAVVVLTGCMASNRHSVFDAARPTYVVGNSGKADIFALVDAHLNGETIESASSAKSVFDYEPTDAGVHTRAMIKIQDGCDNFCSFCIIPYVRGRAVSRPPGEICENIRKVLDFGYREVTLTGVNIGRYRHEDADFEDLVESILQIPGQFRLRISSLEPIGFGERLIDMFDQEHLAPHLHLCLQSGSDKMLIKMKRMYSVATYRKMVDRIRRRHPDFNLTTDIMVGFPGETEEDFERSCQLARDIGFSHIHTFKYSPRKGTPAWRMPGQVCAQVKTRRSRLVHEISKSNKQRYYASFIGRNEVMLTEKQVGAKLSGYGQYYIPLLIDRGDLTSNQFVTATITGITDESPPRLIAEIAA